MTVQQQTTPAKPKNEVREWIITILVTVVLAFLIRTFIFSAYLVDGPSMNHTLENRERIVVNKFVYYLHSPRPGDVVVFHATPTDDYVKRVIAVEGQTVEVRNGTLYVDGKAKEEPYVNRNSTEISNANPSGRDFPLMTIGKGQVFVMGDNRWQSNDSREFGPIKVTQVVGRADLVMWPMNKMKVIP